MEIDLLSTMIPRSKAEYLLRHDSLAQVLAKGPPELEVIGLTPKEIARLQAIPEMIRASSIRGKQMLSPKAAFDYLEPKGFGRTEEIFGLICLNAKSYIVGERIIAMGTATSTSVTPREVFKEALRLGAVSILVWHNHPSGAPEPSPDDKNLTDCLRKIGQTLGIPLVDHIIVSSSGCYSFRKEEAWDAK